MEKKKRGEVVKDFKKFKKDLEGNLANKVALHANGASLRDSSLLLCNDSVFFSVVVPGRGDAAFTYRRGGIISGKTKDCLTINLPSIPCSVTEENICQAIDAAAVAEEIFKSGNHLFNEVRYSLRDVFKFIDQYNMEYMNAEEDLA